MRLERGGESLLAKCLANNNTPYTGCRGIPDPTKSCSVSVPQGDSVVRLVVSRAAERANGYMSIR